MVKAFLQGVEEFLIQHGAALETQRRGSTNGQPEGLPLLTLQGSATAWIMRVEIDLNACHVPMCEWKYGCYLFMPMEVRERMKTRGATGRIQNWLCWIDFKQDFVAVFDFYYGHKNNIREKMVPRLEQLRPGLQMGHPSGLPPLDSISFSSVWIPTIKTDFAACNMPREWEARAAMLYLPVHIRQVIERLHVENWEQNRAEWTLDDFIQRVQAYLDRLSLLRSIGKGVAGAAAGAILGPPLIVGALGVLGFGAAGVAAGSAAAAIQSAVYGGATTGLFSICQSIGAVGVGAAGTAICSAIGGITAAKRR